jgi:hypothetical protein
MPFQSEKQRRFLHANHPEIAKRWEKEYAHGGISNHFRKKYSLGEGPVMEETDQTDFISSLTQEQVDDDPERYAQLLLGLRKPDFFMGEGDNQRAYFIQSDNSRISVPWGFRGYGLSYEPTIDFKNGGILDINESEEIISDDGNDIELTDYNAAFDDPKDLSTGVKSLFQAKDGGRIGFANGPPGGGETSLGSGAAYSGGASDRGPRDAPDRHGPVSKPSQPQTVPEGINIHDDTGKEEEPYVLVGGQKVHQSLWGTTADSREKYDTEEQILDGTYAFNPTGATKKHTYLTGRTKVAYDKALADQKAKLKKMGLGKLFKAALMLIAGVPPNIVMKTVMITPSDMKTVIEASIPVMNAKKAHMTALGNAKADYEELGMAKFHHAVDTEIQTIDQELLDLTRTKDDDKDDKGDGPSQVVPISEEIDAYAQDDYYMSPWERIKANQAKRAMLVEKDIIQENPVVDESVTDITMQANRGGLANLFRVKNQ